MNILVELVECQNRVSFVNAGAGLGRSGMRKHKQVGSEERLHLAGTHCDAVSGSWCLFFQSCLVLGGVRFHQTSNRLAGPGGPMGFQDPPVTGRACVRARGAWGVG